MRKTMSRIYNYVIYFKILSILFQINMYCNFNLYYVLYFQFLCKLFSQINLRQGSSKS
jgi:hypothetical protein